MMAVPPADSSFRYVPGGVLVSVALAAVSFYGVVLMLRTPDIVSPKGILLLAISSVAGAIMSYGAALHWTLSWRFTITPTHLRARHEYRRTHLEVPWSSIVRVTRLPRRLFGPGRLLMSEIETRTGDRIRFATHLRNYATFLNEVRTRAVNCRVFDPYPGETDR